MADDVKHDMTRRGGPDAESDVPAVLVKKDEVTIYDIIARELKFTKGLQAQTTKMSDMRAVLVTGTPGITPMMVASPEFLVARRN